MSSAVPPLSTAQAWVAGARPRTLPAAIVPVAVGTALAYDAGDVVWWRVVAAAVVALALQIGTNYANDYSDGIRGTDDVRVGPVRLVASGLKSPPAVKRAAFLSFAVAGLAGLALAATTTWWLVPVGVAAVAAGWFYTGGPRPYGYAGFGEVFVFVFFGLVATIGSFFVHTEDVTPRSAIAGTAVGLLAVALLVVNNLRDIPTDAASGKRTLAVRLGDGQTRVLWELCVAGGVILGAIVSWPLTLLALAVGWPAAKAVRRGARGRDLIAVLQQTARVQLAFGVLVVTGVLAL